MCVSIHTLSCTHKNKFLNSRKFSAVTPAGIQRIFARQNDTLQHVLSQASARPGLKSERSGLTPLKSEAL